jgi:hypothetical protein
LRLQAHGPSAGPPWLLAAALGVAGSWGAPAVGSDVPDVMVLLDRAISYATDYGAAFRPVVAEEDYEQAEWIRGAPRRWRHLRSDFVMLRAAGRDRWLGFRDVREVDGHAVKNRDVRLKRLLTGPREGRRLRDEAARYNIGEVRRNVNVPTLALRFLESETWERSQWEVRGEEEVQGVLTVRLAFEEKIRPTLVQSLSLRSDVPAHGTFWVDPDDGTVVQSRLVLEEEAGAEGDITVTYRYDGHLSMWLPAEMDEVYSPDLGRRPFDATRCRAVYSHYVSAEVQTRELGIRLPPEPSGEK